MINLLLQSCEFTPAEFIKPRNLLNVPSKIAEAAATIFKDFLKGNQEIIENSFQYVMAQIENPLFKYQYLEWSSQLPAEHMTKTGATPVFAISEVIKLIKNCEKPPQMIIDALNYALKIKKMSQELIFLSDEKFKIEGDKIANQAKIDIQKLKEGESLAIPVSCIKHSMVMLITCSEIAKDGHKVYKVVQHNEGLGCYYHYYKITKDGKLKFQTALEITDVLEENLTGSNASFLYDLFGNVKADIETIYEKVLAQLKGKIAPASEDERLWSHGQVGGSCTTRCCLSLIRHLMPCDEYKKFKNQAKFKILFSLFSLIKKGNVDYFLYERISDIALEIIRNIAHLYSKQGLPVPSELKKMKDELKIISLDSLVNLDFEIEEADESIELESDNNQMVFENVIGNVDYAFSILKKREFSHKAIKSVIPYVQNAIENIDKKLDDPETEFKKMVNISLMIKEYLGKKPLTRKQIYITTVLLSVMKNIKITDSVKVLMDDGSHEIGRKDYDKMLEFKHIMIDRFFALNLNSYFSYFKLDGIVSNPAKHPTQPLMSPKMKEMKEAMESN